jgi:hypothetical protein
MRTSRSPCPRRLGVFPDVWPHWPTLFSSPQAPRATRRRDSRPRSGCFSSRSLVTEVKRTRSGASTVAHRHARALQEACRTASTATICRGLTADSGSLDDFQGGGTPRDWRRPRDPYPSYRQPIPYAVRPKPLGKAAEPQRRGIERGRHWISSRREVAFRSAKGRSCKHALDARPSTVTSLPRITCWD